MISADLAQSAIDSTARTIRQHQQTAAIYKALLSSSAVGKVINRSIVDRVAPLFPGFRVTYCRSDYGLRWIDLRITRLPDDPAKSAGPLESYTITIGNDKLPRLDRDYLKSKSDEYAENARKLKSSLADFSDALAQYNNMLPYFDALRARLYPVMHTLPNFRSDLY